MVLRKIDRISSELGSSFLLRHRDNGIVMEPLNYPAQWQKVKMIPSDLSTLLH